MEATNFVPTSQSLLRYLSGRNDISPSILARLHSQRAERKKCAPTQIDAGFTKVFPRTMPIAVFTHQDCSSVMGADWRAAAALA